MTPFQIAGVVQGSLNEVIARYSNSTADFRKGVDKLQESVSWPFTLDHTFTQQRHILEAGPDVSHVLADALSFS